MRCPKCAIENPEDSRFCRRCGAPVQAERICPSCGASHPPDSDFCNQCGHRLVVSPKPPGPPSIDYQKPHSYTPKHLTEKILTTRSAMEGERKAVTVLFADVAGFTSLYEKAEGMFAEMGLEYYLKQTRGGLERLQSASDM